MWPFESGVLNLVRFHSGSFFFFFSFSDLVAQLMGLVSQPGIEPALLALEAWNLNHCTAGKSLVVVLEMLKFLGSLLSWIEQKEKAGWLPRGRQILSGSPFLTTCSQPPPS